MAPMDVKGELLIANLIRLLHEGKLENVRDDTSPASNNRFVFSYNGIDFATEWLQDDKPALFIDGEEVIRAYYAKPLIIELRNRFDKFPEPLPEVERYRKEQEDKKQRIITMALDRLKMVPRTS